MGCQHRGAADVKTMTFLSASMSLAEPECWPVDVLAVGGNTNTERTDSGKNTLLRAIIVKRGGGGGEGVVVEVMT